MTRLRYALVAVSVALFTLALGVALGAGPLQGQVRTALQSEVEAGSGASAEKVARVAQDNRALTRRMRYGREFAQAASADLLAGELTDRAVVVLALPGVPEDTVRAVADDIRTAGGTLTATLRVGSDLVDPTARPLVDELADRMLPELDDVDVGADASVYTRVGAVVARALLTTEDAGVALDEPARSVFNTFATADLLQGDMPGRRASAAVVLVPEPPGRPGATAGRQTVVTELVAALDAASDGVVVAGPTSAAAGDGLLRAVRRAAQTSQDVSSVEATETRAGQIATVLALAEETRGTSGHYGLGPGTTAVLP